jgi:tetratricopeptide (TPR) repeat protein
VNRGGPDRESVGRCLDQLQRAINLDDKFALAWVLKSNAHDEAQIYFPEQVAYHRTQADDAAQRAFALEPNLPQVHLELAFKALARLDWITAEAEFARARALGLSDDEMGQYAYLLVSTGHIRRARDLFRTLQASDPLNATLFMYLGVTYDILGDTGAAVEFYERGKALFPNWPAGDFNELVILWGRNDAGAKRLATTIPGPVFAAINPLYENPPAALTELNRLYGNAAYADPINRIAIAASAAYFGDHDLALRALIDASEAVPLYAHKFWQPLFSEVRKLSGFKDFMRGRGFLDYWRRNGWPDQCRAFGGDNFTCE